MSGPATRKAPPPPGGEMMMWIFYVIFGAPIMFLVGVGIWALICHAHHASMDSQPPAYGLCFGVGAILIPPLIRGFVALWRL